MLEDKGELSIPYLGFWSDGELVVLAVRLLSIPYLGFPKKVLTEEQYEEISFNSLFRVQTYKLKWDEAIRIANFQFPI